MSTSESQRPAPKPEFDTPYALDTSQRVASTCLIGVFTALNAIRDSYVLVDAPDCAHLKTQFVAGNHDWLSTLVSISGYHRVGNTGLHCWKVIDKRDEAIVALLAKMGQFEGSGVVFMTSMPMATIVGIDYARLCNLAAEQSGTETYHIVDRAIDGDWMDGYAEVLLTLAKTVRRDPAIAPDPHKVAIVGNLMDRNEEDHQGNLRELRRLLEGLGLELSTVWAGGESWAEMKRGVQEAGAILSFPYARKAARKLARSLKVPLVECGLPFGLPKTIAWLEQLGETFDRREEAKRLIESELRRIMPRLEFVVPYQFLHRRLVFVGDPFLAEGFADIATDLGCTVQNMAITARRQNCKNLPTDAPYEILVDPTTMALTIHVGQRSQQADLVVSCNTSGPGALEAGNLEFGFPAYERHALYDRPFLGFSGFMAFVDDMARELRKVDQTKLRSAEQRKRGDRGPGGDQGPGGPGGPGGPPSFPSMGGH